MLYSDAVQINGNKMGTFEAHTKGTGSQIMKKQGWSDGDALGNPDRKGRKSKIQHKVIIIQKWKKMTEMHCLRIAKKHLIEGKKVIGKDN